MDTARILSEGTAGWLQYEFFCERSHLFSERYMSVPIANLLNVKYKAPVHSEYLHPVLAPHVTGPGRRPEVDFAVIEKYPKIKCVVETKWVGKGGLSAEDIIWDLLRLELIAEASGAPAFFLLGGRKKHIQKFLTSRAFLGKPNKRGAYRRLLKIDSRRNARIRIDSPAKDRRPVFERLFEKYQNVLFPTRITTSICHSYPKECPQFQYSVYAWEVVCPKGTPRFKPADHKYYKV